jgi:transcriptional regulator with XRE-family HTH domain
VSVGQRLREERLRLQMSQPAFASLANVTKGALVKWEKDNASPNAQALIAFGEAGADAVYILTGKRSPVMHAAEKILSDELDEIERDLLEPTRERRFEETDDDAERRVLRTAREKLETVFKYDVPAGLPQAYVERAQALQEIVSDPSKLPIFRAADFAQKRRDREDAKELLSLWFQGWPYSPNDSVMKQLVVLAMDYGVPYKLLVELSTEIYIELTGDAH